MPATTGKYAPQATRKHVTPPHVSLRVLRTALGLTLDDVSRRVREQFPEINVSRGTLSAIENGDRGASEHMLRVLCAALAIDDGALTTDYVPRARELPGVDAA